MSASHRLTSTVSAAFTVIHAVLLSKICSSVWTLPSIGFTESHDWQRKEARYNTILHFPDLLPFLLPATLQKHCFRHCPMPIHRGFPSLPEPVRKNAFLSVSVAAIAVMDHKAVSMSSMVKNVPILFKHLPIISSLFSFLISCQKCTFLLVILIITLIFSDGQFVFG